MMTCRTSSPRVSRAIIARLLWHTPYDDHRHTYVPQSILCWPLVGTSFACRSFRQSLMDLHVVEEPSKHTAPKIRCNWGHERGWIPRTPPVQHGRLRTPSTIRQRRHVRVDAPHRYIFSENRSQRKLFGRRHHRYSAMIDILKDRAAKDGQHTFNPFDHCTVSDRLQRHHVFLPGK